ncbi:MAG: hypothetical protein K2J93_00125 [Anaeroplasmataceae bacterium]|nr:hypothetical protein [Anaeroplasmataceae bacterium]
MKESRIVQTITLTVFIALGMFLTIGILNVNLVESLKNMAGSIQGEENVEGEAALVYVGMALVTIGIGAIFFYVLAIIILITSLIYGLLAIYNIKSSNKWVRYFNYFLVVCCLFMFVSSIVKMILWRCGY